MEEILERFKRTMGGAREDDDLSHKDLYKNWGKYGNQEERRTEILRQQKSNRENKLDNCRGIINLMNCAEEKSSVFNNSSQARYHPRVYVPGFSKTSNFYYDNVLMHSEWMVEKPEDFSTNWYVLPCPKGTRTLVVASNILVSSQRKRELLLTTDVIPVALPSSGPCPAEMMGMTKCYTKYGQLYRNTTTLLPGGNENEKWKNCSVLDGFYCKDTNTMYVLDILSWNNHVMADGELEFRRYWLETTFSEQPALERVSKKNKLSFKLLPKAQCDWFSLQKFMMTYPPLKSAKLDGLLFYHKHAQYVAGETPLVGWLYPYMVPEILCPDMNIHELYVIGKPQDYVNQATFIQKFEEKYSKKNRWRKKTQSSSETSMDAEYGSVGQDVKDNVIERTHAANTLMKNTASGINQTLNIGDGQIHVGNTQDVVYPQCFQEQIEHGISLFSNQDPTHKPVKITKYYSYF